VRIEATTLLFGPRPTKWPNCRRYHLVTYLVTKYFPFYGTPNFAISSKNGAF